MRCELINKYELYKMYIRIQGKFLFLFIEWEIQRYEKTLAHLIALYDLLRYTFKYRTVHCRCKLSYEVDSETKMF